jgi:hypothetical protein
MQMTALDLKAWNTRQCLPGRPRFTRLFGVRSDRRVSEVGPGTAPSGMGIDNENDQVS